MLRATGDSSELDAGDGGSCACSRARTGVCISPDSACIIGPPRDAALESDGGGLGVFSLSRAMTCSGRVERLRGPLGAGSCASAAAEEEGPFRKAAVASWRNASTSRVDERDVAQRCCRWGMLVNASRVCAGTPAYLFALSELLLGPGWLLT